MRPLQRLLHIPLLLFFLLSFPPYSISQENELEEAEALNTQVIQLYEQGRYSEAVRLADKVLALSENVLGPDHPDVGTSLDNLAALYYAMGDYARAEPLYERSLEIRERALGPDHPDVGQSLNGLANLYSSMGDYAKAEPLYMQSLATWEKALGPEHPDVAKSLNNLAYFYNSIGKFSQAKPLYERSLIIWEKALGNEHPHLATGLDGLAGVYVSLGDYAKAEPLYKRSLDIYEKTLGSDHPNVALSLNNLAGLYISLNDFAAAEPLYKRSLAIWEKTLGPDHPDVAVSLNNLGRLYESIGDLAKAEALYNRSLEIREKAFGPEHPSVATSLNNLGALYNSRGEYAKAVSSFDRSFGILDKMVGPDHPDMATVLNNLATLYQSAGDYSNAQHLLRRSLDILEKSMGPDHPNFALGLNNLAYLYDSLEDYEQAETLYHKALAIWESALGTDHPDVVLSLNNLAGIYARQGKFRKAHSLNIRIQGIEERLIDQVLGFTSESQQTLFLSTRLHELEAALSLAVIHLSEIHSVRKDTLDMWLRRKGMSLEAQRRFQEALVYSDDPEVLDTFQELARVRTRLSQMIFRGPGEEGIETYRNTISELEAARNDLEARLSRLSQVYALRKKIERADSTKVARALPEKTALMEFVRSRIRNFKAKADEEAWLAARYITFVLHAGDGERVEMIDLGDAEEIDKTVTLFKRELNDSRDKEGIRRLEASRRLHDLVFEPLKKALGDVTEVFISPDGNLNLIPFEVLQDPDGRVLIEDYTFNYLAAGRDIIGFGEIKQKGGRPLLMGDPDFDLGTEERGATLRSLELAGTVQDEHGRRSTDMQRFSFKRLPGTREEVKTIKELLGEAADVYTGKEALEEVLRQKGAPLILHLATHGFFLGDVDLSFAREEDRGIQLLGSPMPPAKGIKLDNPLLRSGIALAGANSALQSEDPEKSDGIVTAQKILGLRLRGTDMVVLSACETGVGEVKSGEGVYGLRRAFTQAGTRGLVMSMWSVPDKETKELMIEFYKNILSGSMTRSQALRQAALKQKEIVQKRYGTDNPLYWGGFVFMGEP